MNYLLWFGVFMVLALLATVPVHFHLASLNRKQDKSPDSPDRPRQTRPCPRCGQAADIEAAFCNNCGVPMMLWALKNAREVSEQAPGKVMPVINQDVCIGCSACVNACEEDVLQIVAGKSSVVNPSACTSAGTCAAVCPTGACQLGGSGAARRVEVPKIDENFQTNQQGIYAIGELGGLGLIKSAIAEGQLVVERILAGHQSREGLLDLVIIGSGPAGLSAALAAQQAGLKTVVLEQGSFANTIRRYPNRKIVMAEPIRIPMYGSLWISDAPKETLLGVWETIIKGSGLRINEYEPALKIGRREDGTFETETAKGRYSSQKVILAIGKRGTPNELKVPGSELPKLFYTLTDTAQYQNSRILVVGGGDSAIEAAVSLAKQPGNEVSLSYRRTEFTRLRDKNLQAITEATQQGSVRLLLGTEVQAISEQEACLVHSDGGRTALENDYVFAFLGGTSPKDFLERLGIEMVTKEIAMTVGEAEHATA